VTEVRIPAVCLVVLVGASGSGKSTFGRAHFGRYEVVSSDACRGMVGDDENDQSVTPQAFELLNTIVRARLTAGRLTVVDATNVQRHARTALVALAREHDVLPVAVVLDLPERVCLERNAGRPDRTFGDHVVRRQVADLRRSLRGLAREGFRGVHVLKGEDDVAAATVVREPLRNDLRDRTGPFDVVGDVHGCRAELEELLAALGYRPVRDRQGRVTDAVPPDGRTAVFLGDLVDRGPDSPGVLRLVMGMVAAGHALAVPGNHENKLVRALRGRQVQVSHGLAETLDQLAAEPEAFRDEALAFLDGLVSHLVLDGGRLVVAHAGLRESFHGRASGRVRSFALYGDTTGETDEYGLPVRYPWAEEYRGRATVLYGHTPVVDPVWVNGTLCLDTGCVFGGRLTALRYPERELVSVPAHQVWYEPARPLAPSPGPGPAPATVPATAPARDPAVLDVDDVLGRRVVETRLLGAVTVREENAAGALEVMSRFALAPARLVYLPPTMAPVDPAAGEAGNLLEHPQQAFDAYRSDGVGQVVCEEKHMGSRAVVLLCRDAATAAGRFGIDDGTLGTVHTRTGRPFFATALAARLLDRLAAAASAAGLWGELDTGWLLLDTELLPWSAKAEELLRSRYAATGAAALAALPAAVEALEAREQAAGTGRDVAVLLDRLLTRLRDRHEDAEAYVRAYRPYAWPTSGLDGVQVAPFQVLASDGATHHDRDHGWHLAVADRLVEADPALVRPTRRLVVDTGDPDAVRAGTAWWEELTGAGGEGMVVKPLANLTRGTRGGLVQPGLKVRGREYLRIIYGPGYCRPEALERLRHRSGGRKRSLALREYALGLEALERFVAGEPLWRVHEAVFAVLALESEPVDPRL